MQWWRNWSVRTRLIAGFVTATSIVAAVSTYAERQGVPALAAVGDAKGHGHPAGGFEEF
jgi:hypothetical protein